MQKIKKRNTSIIDLIKIIFDNDKSIGQKALIFDINIKKKNIKKIKMNEPKELLQAIEACRLSGAISQYSIIKNTGMHKRTVNMIHDGSGNPRLDILCEYCTYVGAEITITPLSRKSNCDFTEAELLDSGEENKENNP